MSITKEFTTSKADLGEEEEEEKEEEEGEEEEEEEKEEEERGLRPKQLTFLR